jgi:hypothetical protein
VSIVDAAGHLTAHRAKSVIAAGADSDLVPLRNVCRSFTRWWRFVAPPLEGGVSFRQVAQLTAIDFLKEDMTSL